jgi:perosamine synthetase
MNIPSHRITFTDGQIADILRDTEEILRSGQVILGKKTQQFEQEFAAACDRRYGVAVSSDTAAFEMQLKTVGVEGEYVLFPALAFPSILEAVVNAGGIPWFVDGSWDGHLFARLHEIQDAVSECKDRTGKYPKALILMHTAGLIARDSAEIADWCAMEGIAVLEDAAHSFGATLNGRPAGSYGVSSAFSLYATKPMHACEGGIIVTDDPIIASEAKLMRNYGRTHDFGRSVVVRHGNSWRITEIQSAIGMSNLSVIGDSIARRREIMSMYDRLIPWDVDEWSQMKRLATAESMRPNGYRYVIVGPECWNHGLRQEFKEQLKKDTGIDLPGEVYELPTHEQPVWEDKYGELSMPMAESFCQRHFALPVYQSMTDEQVRYVVDSVTKGLFDYV